MKKSKVVIILFILSFIALSSNKAFASYIYDDNFDTYTTGGLNGQGSWYWLFGFGDATVINSLSDTSPNSINVDNAYVSVPTSGISTGDFDYKIYGDCTSGSGGGPWIKITSSPTNGSIRGNGEITYDCVNSTTMKASYLSGGQQFITNMPSNQWNTIHIVFNDGSGAFDYSYNGNASVSVPTGSGGTGYMTIQQYNSIGSSHWYIDTIGTSIPPDTSTITRIATVTSPFDGSIQASTTVTFSGTFYVASSTIATTSNTFMYLYVQNMSNDTATSSLNDYTILNFPVTSLDTILTFSTTTVLADNSRFSWNASVRRGDVTYGTVPFTDGKSFYQFTTGSFDPTFGKSFDLTSCNPLGNFNIGQCIYNLIFPNNVIFPIAFNEAKDEFGTRAPWGYVTRVINILIATTTSTSMPTIDYSFASSSPMSSIGNIHFEPFTLIAQSGTLINEFKSDRSDSKTVWEIFMPFINMFIYIVLLFMIIHDLTGIHGHRQDNDKQKE